MRNGFTIHHNGPNANCLGKPHSRCVAFWESVRRYHMVDKGWSNIAYSFGVCPHGTRFAGGGWLGRQFANGDDLVGADDGDDSEWYTVLVFLGWDEATGVEEQPTADMVWGVANLIDEGRRMRRCGDRVLPHNAFKQKRCPGHAFTALAKSWDNAPLTIPDMYDDTPAPVSEDPDMLIIDSAGKPALVIGVGGVKRLSAAQRNALRTIGVDAKNVDNATSDALFSLADKGFDVQALAAELDKLVDAAPGSLTRDEVAAEVDEALARVFAAGAAAADGTEG